MMKHFINFRFAKLAKQKYLRSINEWITDFQLIVRFDVENRNITFGQVFLCSIWIKCFQWFIFSETVFTQNWEHWMCTFNQIIANTFECSKFKINPLSIKWYLIHRIRLHPTDNVDVSASMIAEGPRSE